MSTGQLIIEIPDQFLNLSRLQQIDFFPNGLLVIGTTIATSTNIYVWNVTKRMLSHTFTANFESMKIKPLNDNHSIASGDTNGNLIVWDIDGSILTHLTVHSEQIICIQQMPNGLVITGSNDKNIILWNLTANSSLSKLAPFGSLPFNLMEVVSENLIVVGSFYQNYILFVQILANFALAIVEKISISCLYVRTIAVLNSNTLAIVTDNQYFNIYNITSQEMKNSLPLNDRIDYLFALGNLT